MRRPRRGTFENELPPGKARSWAQILTGVPYEGRSERARGAEPFPMPFCIAFIILSSLVIYGAIYSLLTLL